MIDDHHHLWSYSATDYPWIPEGSPLAQDQLLPELAASAKEAGITGTVVVQARQISEESDFLLNLADKSDLIQGVVGWVPLIDERVEEWLSTLSAHPKFKGVRHVLQDEPDAYFDRADFHRGLAKLPHHSLSYDLLIYQRQIAPSLRLIDRHPELAIILDHIAKPEARNGRIEKDWRSGMRELASRDNVLGVKFSGLLTEFPSGDIDPDTVRAYFEETLEIFGAERVMFGSDWPVCLLRAPSCAAWAETVRSLAATLTGHEREGVLEANAIRLYHLGA
ncbi:MAG: amidohydrolase family protein [Verrucomicrobiales bacterium]